MLDEAGEMEDAAAADAEEAPPREFDVNEYVVDRVPLGEDDA
jgi:hypothetical protein